MYILVLGLCLNTQETNRFDDVGNQYNICLDIEKVKATMSKWKKVKRKKRSDFTQKMLTKNFGGVCSFNPYKSS